TLAFPLIRTHNLFSLNTVADSTLAQGSILMQVVLVPAFLVAGVLVVKYSRLLLPTLWSLNPFLILLIAWCACSVLWSPYPLVSMKRTVQQIGLVLIALTITLPLIRANYLSAVLLRTTTLLLVVSLLVVLVVPLV